jgi:aminoglycoside phosphotransferase (APT) family kinase protein
MICSCGWLPRIHWAVGQVEKEQAWLPKFAPLLPLAIPAPLAKGEPGEGYPWHWSVYRWLDGEIAPIEHSIDPHQAAIDLAHFITALQQIDATNGPPPGPHNSSRGEPLALRDARTRQAITTLQADINSDLATAVWNAAVDAPVWDGQPVWIHGDLQAGNLLAVQGRLSAVIDFGCLGVGVLPVM